MNGQDKRQALQTLFKGRQDMLDLYDAFEQAVLARFPDTGIVVQKTQVAMRNRYIFAVASPPVRKIKGRPGIYLVVSLGLARPLDDARAVEVVEPYPGRFTNHILIESADEVDEQLMQWVEEAYHFSMSK